MEVFNFSVIQIYKRNHCSLAINISQNPSCLSQPLMIFQTINVSHNPLGHLIFVTNMCTDTITHTHTCFGKLKRLCPSMSQCELQNYYRYWHVPVRKLFLCFLFAHASVNVIF